MFHYKLQQCVSRQCESPLCSHEIHDGSIESSLADKLTYQLGQEVHPCGLGSCKVYAACADVLHVSRGCDGIRRQRQQPLCVAQQQVPCVSENAPGSPRLAAILRSGQARSGALT